MPTNAKRNVSDFMGDRLDVKMFGAVGDGIVNDTAAFTAGIAELSIGSCLSIPRTQGGDPYLLNTAPAWPVSGSAMLILDPGASLSGAGNFIARKTMSSLHFHKVDNDLASKVPFLVGSGGVGIINPWFSPAVRIDLISQSGNVTVSSCALLMNLPDLLGKSYTTTTASITANASPQSVGVVDSSMFFIGELATVMVPTVDFEQVEITNIADSTHVEAVFTQNHASGVKFGPSGKGDKIGWAVSMSDQAANTNNIYGSNLNLTCKSPYYHTVDCLEIDIINSSGVDAGFFAGNAPYIRGMSIHAVGANTCTYGLFIGPIEWVSSFLNGITILTAVNNALSIGSGGGVHVPINGLNIWNALTNGIIIGANQTSGDDPRFPLDDPLNGIFLTARASYSTVAADSNRIRMESLTASVAHTMDLYHGQSATGLRFDYDNAWTGCAITATGQVDTQSSFRLKNSSTNVDMGRFDNIANAHPALCGGGTDNALYFYSTVLGTGSKGYFAFFDNMADNNAAMSFNTSNAIYQFRGQAPVIRIDGEADRLCSYQIYSEGGSPVAPVLKGRFVYYGSAAAGSRYIGIINDSADYIGLAGDVRVTGSLTVGGTSLVGLPNQAGHSGQFLKTNATVADWAQIAAGDFAVQNANTGLMGPATGADAVPTFRALVSADIPNNAANTSGKATTSGAADTVVSIASHASTELSDSTGLVRGAASLTTDHKVVAVGTDGSLEEIPNQAQNYVYAGLATGGAGAPAFRAMVAADIPGTLNGTTVAGNLTLSAYGIIWLAYGSMIRNGPGDPDGWITAPIGSLHLRTDGGANTSLYVKESGTGTTGWVAYGAGLPAQSGHSGQFLKTDATTADWAALAQADIPAMFTDRGDPSAYDITEAGLTKDSTWHDLDLSSYGVPDAATAVVLRVSAAHSSSNALLMLRKNGNSYEINTSQLRTQVANIYVDTDLTIPLGSGAVIEYWVASGGTWDIDIIVKGWIK